MESLFYDSCTRQDGRLVLPSVPFPNDVGASDRAAYRLWMNTESGWMDMQRVEMGGWLDLSFVTCGIAHTCECGILYNPSRSLLNEWFQEGYQKRYL